MGKRIAIFTIILFLAFFSYTAASETAHHPQSLPLITVIPFVIMLLCIAVIPLVKEHWWEDNWNKLKISCILGIPMGIYILFISPHELLEIMEEYISFIIYVGSLFVVSGGIMLKGDVKVSPKINLAFIGIGGLLASFIGTPGASMLLIRPILRINAGRKYVMHTVIFFIFIVSNIGGCLTPLGDPPLFLGYLNGVPFSWTFRLWPNWLFMVSLLLVIYFLIDSFLFRKEELRDTGEGIKPEEPLKVEGLINFLWLFGIILSVAFLPIFPYREIVMLLMVAISLLSTKKGLRKENKFTYHPINEVAFLFFGIFLTMIPALMLLKAGGGELGVTEPWHFFWITGVLSSFLDNAPTYLTFFNLAQGLGATSDLVANTGIQESILKAISLGAVFMGANTYIGNGPNFMVKAISDEAGTKMPSFLGYMFWSFGILMPIFVLVTFMTFIWHVL
ncbi:sodium:proton antiporter [candidate division KSB1 bacterium]